MKLTARVATSAESKRLPLAVTALTLMVFSAAIFFVTMRLRTQLRDQIAGRDVHVLQQLDVLEAAADRATAPGSPDEDPGEQDATDELSTLLRGNRLGEMVGVIKEGMLGARLFGADGKLLTTLPPYLTDARIPDAALQSLHALRPVSRFHRAVQPEDLFLDPDAAATNQYRTQPVLEVFLPLASDGQHRLIGVVQLLLEGENILGEFAALDRNLARQALVVFLTGSIVILVSLTWAFRRLEHANKLLSERTASLLKANAELALAARSSAVGAVTAHLIHGLKNPLSGLRGYFADRSNAESPAGEGEWRDAATAARRMQALIDEVVRVLREENGSARYEISIAELVELMAAKVAQAAQQAGVRFQTAGVAERQLSNRDANLVLLILENLLTNAIQATPQGKAVRLCVSAEAGRVAFDVEDEGPGFPSEFRDSVFQPRRSAKPGGAGVGLAISKQLAGHLGASLDLIAASPGGSLFRLTLG